MAHVKERGSLIALVLPFQGSWAVAPNLDLMREQGLKITDLSRPEQFTGAEVEILKGFAQSLGVKLELRPFTTGIDDLLASLARGDGEVAAASLAITPKRLQIVDFSQIEAGEAFWICVVVKRGSKIASIADLAGKKGALLAGSSHLEMIKAMAPKAIIQTTDFQIEAWNQVSDGTADFTVRGANVGPGEAVDPLTPDLVVAFRLAQSKSGIAVHKGSDVLGALDAYVAGLRSSGDLKRLMDKYLPDLTPKKKPTP